MKNLEQEPCNLCVRIDKTGKVTGESCRNSLSGRAVSMTVFAPNGVQQVWEYQCFGTIADCPKFQQAQMQTEPHPEGQEVLV